MKRSVRAIIRSAARSCARCDFAVAGVVIDAPGAMIDGGMRGRKE